MLLMCSISLPIIPELLIDWSKKLECSPKVFSMAGFAETEIPFYL